MTTEKATDPIPYRLTKVELYRYLKKLNSKGVEIFITRPWGNDGWQIRVDNYPPELPPFCESSKVSPAGDHWPLNETDYVIVLARIGMDAATQALFDAAANGDWRNA